MPLLLLFLLFCLITPIQAGGLSLAELQKLALAENPRLRAMEHEAAMMKKRIPQSASLEDPRLKLGINNMPLDKFSFKESDMTSKEIGISQMFLLWGKLGARERIAWKEYEKSLERLRRERAETLHMLRGAVYELAYVRSAMNILSEIKGRIRLVIESEVAANKAGTGSLSGVIKANIEYAMIDEEIITMKQREREAEMRIRYLAGSKVKAELADLREPDYAGLKANEMREKIRSSNPDLKILRADVEISREEIALKKKEYLPDLELGLSYMQRDSGPGGRRPDMWSGMATVNLPVWAASRNAPMVSEMEKRSMAAEGILRDRVNEMDLRTETVLSQMNKWDRLHKLYKERLIPQAELTLETILARYRSSATEFMPVIDTVRMLLRYRKELLMARKEYHAAYSELCALAGMEIVP